MKTIELSQNQKALVDDEDFLYLSTNKWSALYSKGTRSYYAVRSVKVNNKWTTIAMHRIIMNSEKGALVDHINHNTLDNRKENLRVCNALQNAQNRNINNSNKTGHKGVSFHKRDRVFYAYIKYNHKRKHLGSFKDVKEAALAYNKAAKELFGEFANFNKI